ncbi:hypothetical protein [Pseudarthrobacter sp. N5]|uniref:hypothetical protein n=1 Tax=Pseudarthrobacter sp. N5 TaxID=3418416 RepID=UPI003CE7065C
MKSSSKSAMIRIFRILAIAEAFFGVAVFAGISAIFPFATVLFERWAEKRNCLAVSATPIPAPPATAGV